MESTNPLVSKPHLKGGLSLTLGVSLSFVTLADTARELKLCSLLSGPSYRSESVHAVPVSEIQQLTR